MKPRTFKTSKCERCGEPLHRFSKHRKCKPCISAEKDPTPEDIEDVKRQIREENLAEQRARVHHDNWEMSIRDPRVFRLKMD